jgi:hypothetical protein
MKNLTRMAALAAVASALMGCAVYAPAPAPVAYAPAPAYYGAPVAVGVGFYGGGWHGAWHGGWHGAWHGATHRWG